MLAANVRRPRASGQNSLTKLRALAAFQSEAVVIVGRIKQVLLLESPTPKGKKVMTGQF